MPKEQSIRKVLVIGSGPIVIGQAAEFDYSGTQAIQALKEEGIEVILINSNPATIMTDPNLADKVYIEPLTKEFILKILYKERPDGILPTLGGQTALNLALEIAQLNVLEKLGIKLLGLNLDTLQKAEDRKLFKELMHEIDEPTPASEIVDNYQAALKFGSSIGYPLIIRPAYTLGGSGGGIAHSDEELEMYVKSGLKASPINQCLIEKSIAGFKEIEYEVIRDSKNNCIIICNMENFDPVGIHTGDSIVVAPSQTLSDKEYQLLRNASLKIIRELKIEGACNVQLALDPNSFDYYVIEVNPRVSRSSALASKATGYPIAKIAAKIAVGYSLDEIKNPITKTSYACFEPSLDYVVTKIPRWPFDKFKNANRKLGTQMKATGEIMSIARTFEESLLKGIRSLELGFHHLENTELNNLSREEIEHKLIHTDDERIFVIALAFRSGYTMDEIHNLTSIDRFFLYKIQKIVLFENTLKNNSFNKDLLIDAKELGFTDKKIAELTNKTEIEIYQQRVDQNITPVFKMVDTCAGEFESTTPYLYSTYEQYHDLEVSNREKVIVLGSGPIRIGQGVEFDYSTVHAIQAIKELGMEAIIINNNPETVSTDFDISDRLYFDPLYIEDVMNVINLEKPLGVIVQFGGQTAINLVDQLEKQGVKILGTSKKSIDIAEDRYKFEKLLSDLQIAQPLGVAINSFESAMSQTTHLGFPLMVRPSYVIGGQSMEIIYNKDELEKYLLENNQFNEDKPLLMDRYMIGTEVEIDAICDGKQVFIPGIMEHIEKAGVHSGDSFAVYPPQSLSTVIQKKLIDVTTKITEELNILGLINLQFVIKKDEVYVIEVNPRSSRTIPFLSKVTNVPMAKIATKVILGESLKSMGYIHGLLPETEEISIKAPVFSFSKLTDVDIALGPEMKSTGEIMGKDKSFEKALAKAFTAAGFNIPQCGTILVTLTDKTKDKALPILKRFHEAGFNFMATSGTARSLHENNLPVSEVEKIGRSENDLLQEIKQGSIHLVINTISKGKNVESDGFKMRRAAVENGIMCLTSLDTANALIQSIELNSLSVQSL